MSATVKRVQLDLPPQSLSRLQALKEVTESSSYAEVIKNALRMYEYFVSESEKGKTFYIRDTSGNLSEVVLFI